MKDKYVKVNELLAKLDQEINESTGERGYYCGLQWAKWQLNHSSAIEIEPIVHCDECKWARSDLGNKDYQCCYFLYHQNDTENNIGKIPVEAKHYCANGVLSGKDSD
ncbi:MAG: hypothetical protein J6S67_08590 [Methanobrevibacter sp.]|nr:hypothetical protein [Methanobrevibacter sp.]